MKIKDARTLAESKLREHKLTGWKIVFDRAKARHGQCRYASKEIGLSLWSTMHNTDENVLDTILHEIAHALVGHKHGHDEVWRAKAIEIGCKGERCKSFDVKPPTKYVAVCPFGHEFPRHKKALRKFSCPTCSPKFDVKYLLTYKLNFEHTHFQKLFGN